MQTPIFQFEKNEWFINVTLINVISKDSLLTLFNNADKFTNVYAKIVIINDFCATTKGVIKFSSPNNTQAGKNWEIHNLPPNPSKIEVYISVANENYISEEILIQTEILN